MTAEIALSAGLTAQVDESDRDRVVSAGPWHTRRRGRNCYAQRHVTRNGRRTTEQMHQFITGLVGVDHVNGDGLDNRSANLRPATQALNSANQRLSIKNTSGYKGVTRKANARRWIAQIRVGGRQRYLGTFVTAEAAARAYDAAAAAAWGEFARLNFPIKGA